jgi:hypothetical protein
LNIAPGSHQVRLVFTNQYTNRKLIAEFFKVNDDWVLQAPGVLFEFSQKIIIDSKIGMSIKKCSLNSSGSGYALKLLFGEMTEGTILARLEPTLRTML